MGAYSVGSNKDIDSAIELRDLMEGFLRQSMDESSGQEESFSQLLGCLGGE